MNAPGTDPICYTLLFIVLVYSFSNYMYVETGPAESEAMTKVLGGGLLQVKGHEKLAACVETRRDWEAANGGDDATR